MGNSLKCSNALRNIPPHVYRLPADGRKWKHVCQQRAALVRLMATYADADGSHIKASANTFANAMGLSRRAVQGFFADFHTLKFLFSGKQAGAKAGRWRTLNVAAILLAAGVQNTNPPERASVQDSDQGVQNTESGVQNRKLGVQNTSPTQPPCSTAHLQPPIQPSSEPWWDGWMAELPTPLHGSVLSKVNKTRLDSQITQHGRELIKAAILRWDLNRDMPLDGLRNNKWDAWFREGGLHIQYCLSELATNAQREKNAAAIEANWLQHCAENVAEHDKQLAAYRARKAREGAPAEAYFTALEKDKHP